MGSLGHTARIVDAPGTGARIGLIDTGADSLHADLTGKITANYEVVMGFEECFVEQVAHGIDHNAHGTACAGILNAAAPGAEIHSVQVIGQRPRDNPEKLIAGIAFAVEQGWEIINISAGATTPHTELHHHIRKAYENGTILIAAKDNRPGAIGYPAAYPEVICVDMEHFAEPLDWRYFPGAEIEAEASGIYIDAPVSGGGRKNYTGTSFAAPHLAGIAARWKQRNPDGNMPDFRAYLSK